MIKEAFGTGATITDALAAARKELNAPADVDVVSEIVEQPKKGFLGFGKSLAKARAYYVVEDAAPAAPKTVSHPVADNKNFNRQPNRQASKPANKFAEKPAKPAEKAAKPVEKAAKPAEKTAAKPAEKPAKPVSTASPEAVQGAVDYLTKIINGMGIENVKASYTIEGPDIMIELDCGDDYGVIIGRRGETLDALQYLTRLAVNRISKDYVRVSINVGNYREKREKTLCELAAKNSARVLKYGRNFTFEPMNPYERRIIHTAVQDIEGVTSHSVGTDTERRVVISLAPGVKATNPSYAPERSGGRNSGYNNNRGRSNGPRNGGNGGKGGYNNRSNGPRSEAVTTPTREPRTDDGAQKVSRYGKIN